MMSARESETETETHTTTARKIGNETLWGKKRNETDYAKNKDR
jgi:hypothetical protein